MLRNGEIRVASANMSTNLRTCLKATQAIKLPEFFFLAGRGGTRSASSGAWQVTGTRTAHSPEALHVDATTNARDRPRRMAGPVASACLAAWLGGRPRCACGTDRGLKSATRGRF